MKLVKNIIRRIFCKSELPKGRILVLWRDIDGAVSGWNGDADNEMRSLIMISKIIEDAKITKMKMIVGSPLPNSPTTL